MWKRFSEQAKRVVFYAQENAKAQGGTDVASEHLLLGVIQEVIRHQGLKADETVWPPAPTDRLDLQNAVVLLLREGVSDLEELHLQTKECAAKLNVCANAAELKLTRSAKHVIDAMFKEAIRVPAKGQQQMGAEFLLLALAQDKIGSTGRLLAEFGFDLESARDEVIYLYRLSVMENSPGKPSLFKNLIRRFAGNHQNTQ